MTRRRLLLTRTFKALSLLIALGAGGLGVGAHAASLGASGAQSVVSSKVASDLRTYVNGTTALRASLLATDNTVTWARDLNNALHVKVLINAASTDASLAALRRDVLSRGGSVFYNYLSTRALSAMVPAAALDALALRSDVISISPNRATSRHASL